MPNWMLNLPYSCRFVVPDRLAVEVEAGELPPLPPTNAQTCLPSVLHEAEASVASAAGGCGTLCRCSDESCRHFSLPSVPTHSSTTSCRRPGGEEDLVAPDARGGRRRWPGILSFQTTFLSGPHSVGRPFSARVAVVLRAAPLRPVVGEGGGGQHERGAKTAQEQKTNHRGGVSPRGVKRLAGRDEVIFSSGGVQQVMEVHLRYRNRMGAAWTREFYS